MGELYHPYSTIHLEIRINLDIVYFKIIYGTIHLEIRINLNIVYFKIIYGVTKKIVYCNFEGIFQFCFNALVTGI